VNSSSLRVQKLAEHTISVLSTGCLKKSQDKKFTHDNILDIRTQIFTTQTTRSFVFCVFLSSVLQQRHDLQLNAHENNIESPIMCIIWTTKAVWFDYWQVQIYVFFTAYRASMWPTQSMQWTMGVLSYK